MSFDTTSESDGQSGSLVAALGLRHGGSGLYLLPHRDTPASSLLTPLRATSPDQLAQHFPQARLVSPEALVRPPGHSTLLTTAAVQRVETLLHTDQPLNDDIVAVAQPVVRSQFMDRVREGLSTSFVDFSVIHTRSNVRTFSDLFTALCALVCHSVSANDVGITIETLRDRWGDRSFSKTVLTLHVRSTELGEGVYIHDYPISSSRSIAISDVTFGVERSCWILGGGRYLSHFESFYEQGQSPDACSASIDCIRTACLMAAAGVRPAHQDPGFRLRRLCKRFIVRNAVAHLPVERLIEVSLRYWRDWGAEPVLSDDDARSVLAIELERAFNSTVLAEVATRGGPVLQLNVNQPTSHFIAQARRSLRLPVRDLLLDVIDGLHGEGK